MKAKYLICYLILVLFFSPALAAQLQILPEQKINAIARQKAKEAIQDLPNAESLRLPEPFETDSNQIIVKFVEKVNPELVIKESGVEVTEIKEVTTNLPSLPDNLGLKNSKPWYQFMDKNTRVSGNKEESFRLYYCLTLKQGLTAGDAIDKLTRNPKVEYAMPASLN